MHLADLGVLKHCSKKRVVFSPRFISLSLHFLFHLPSSFSSCLLSCLSSSLSSSSCLLSCLSSSLFSLHSCLTSSLFSLHSCLVLSCLVLSCLVLSCLVLSCLVLSCLVLSCLVLSCLVLSCLVLSCLVLSCLVSPLSSSLAFLSCLVFSCLVLFCLLSPSLLLSLLCRLLFSPCPCVCLSLCLCLCLCLPVSLSISVWCCGRLVVLCCVLCCGVCGVVCGVARWKNPCADSKRRLVHIQHVPVYASTTSTCVKHVDLLPVHTGTFWMYTRGRFESTHGGVLNLHTGGGERREGVIASSAYLKWPTWSHHVTQRFTKSNHWILQISSLRTGREQHVPDSSNRSLYLMKLFVFSCPEGKQAARLFDSFSPLSPGMTNDLNVSIATSLHQRLPFSNLVHHLSSPYSNHFQDHGT